jgi:betaine-aldehyde dehydrogenase
MKHAIRHIHFVGIGGSGMSGYGREMGFDAMREYTQVKSIWVNVDAQIAPHYARP